MVSLNKSFIFLLFLWTFLQAQEPSSIPYRAVVRTHTAFATGTQSKAVESIATIAVKGDKYRLEMIRPAVQTYVCDGTRTVMINPVTGERSKVQSKQGAQQAVTAPLLGRLQKKGKGHHAVDPRWNLPEGIREIEIKSQSPLHVLFSGPGGKAVGRLKVERMARLSKTIEVPAKIVYESSSSNPGIRMVIEYLKLSPDPNMPEEVFEVEGD